MTESLVFASACAEPTKAKVPVVRYCSVASARTCGSLTDTDRGPGVAAVAASSLTEITIAPRPGWSTTSNFFESC
jgi:hypothetical protein